MDIKELNKQQLILLTLLITFVVSIATGIITVSLMEQAPKSVPQTINNVIQRTIEKVTTVPADTTPAKTDDTSGTKGAVAVDEGNAIVSIYPIATAPTLPVIPPVPAQDPKALGEGIIISDVGLILVDSSILTEDTVYRVILDKTDFDATVIKKFSNGFSILKITAKKDTTDTTGVVKGASTGPATPTVDITQ